MNSKIFGVIFSALYVAFLTASLVWVDVTITPAEKSQSDVIYIEYEEPEPPPPPKPKPVPKIKEAPKHEKLAPKDNMQQAEGKAEETRTVNKRALLPQQKAGVDKPDNVGNDRAKQDTVSTASGVGRGLNQIGNVELDEGLQGRGIVGELPVPSNANVSRSGKILVKVIVNKTGRVVTATFQPKGSTIQDSKMVNDALAAARKTRFTEGEAFTEGGVITYYFKLQ